MEKKKFAGQVLFHLMLMLFLGGMFAVGTFYDQQIASAIYTPDLFPAVIVTTIGIYPFFSSSVLFLGVLFERTVHSKSKMPLKIFVCMICIGLSLFSGFEGSKILLSVDCLGGMFPLLNRNYPLIAAVSITLVYPLFYLGYRIAEKNDDKLLTQKVTGLIITMLLAVILMESIKSLFSRPRYRIAVKEYDGIGFVPWYTPFSGAAGFIKELGLEKTDFRSFPSGHSIMSISCIYIFAAYSWIFPKLREKDMLMCFIGLIFGLTVMFTRMILGAHYLSDVSAGAMIGAVLSFVFTIIQHSMNKNS